MSAERCIGADIVRGKVRAFRVSCKLWGTRNGCVISSHVCDLVSHGAPNKVTQTPRHACVFLSVRIGFVSLGFFRASISKAIANAANGFDAIGEFAEFAAKRRDVHVDGTR